MITIINYGLGNIKAFCNIFIENKIPFNIANHISDLDETSKIILPGVGSFDYAMTKLNESGMRDHLDYLVLEKKIPVLGVCVGMQLLAKSSEEGTLEGLNYIKGGVKKIVKTVESKENLPHMGWNVVKPTFAHPLFKGLDENPLFYFLHSYYFDCLEEKSSLATTKFINRFSAAVHHEHIFGVQFHPEKSHKNGSKFLLNFVNYP